jgi:hypothetical protein
MSARILASLALIALAALILVVIIDPAFAQRPPGGVPTPTPRGAPGPIAGAGLPVLAIGAGAYWLFRRFRRKTD